ncbi:hypothetical protein TKK_0009501 [Trichogramma kaykai]|uniref:HTH psq-type domain-containing protein n=1 Tax=Trichogramma kaykai TaxID=54128 RepID=A0ABD2WZZ9_9HYME
MSHKRKRLSIVDKVAIIQELQKVNMSYCEAGEKFGGTPCTYEAIVRCCEAANARIHIQMMQTVLEIAKQTYRERYGLSYKKSTARLNLVRKQEVLAACTKEAEDIK